jgi:hypothetical protein
LEKVSKSKFVEALMLEEKSSLREALSKAQAIAEKVDDTWDPLSRAEA